jgi:hypothetical protein
VEHVELSRGIEEEVAGAAIEGLEEMQEVQAIEAEDDEAIIAGVEEGEPGDAYGETAKEEIADASSEEAAMDA